MKVELERGSKQQCVRLHTNVRQQLQLSWLHSVSKWTPFKIHYSFLMASVSPLSSGENRQHCANRVLWFLPVVLIQFSSHCYVRSCRKYRLMPPQSPGLLTTSETDLFVRLKGWVSEKAVSNTGAPQATVLSRWLWKEECWKRCSTKWTPST